MQWSAGFILSGSPAPSVCHHTEQTSLNVLFIAGASQRSPWWHINNSLQRDASLFSRSAQANEKHSYWLPPPRPPSLLMIIIVFPLFIMIRAPPLRGTGICTSCVQAGTWVFRRAGALFHPPNLLAGVVGGAHIISDKRDDLRRHYLFSHDLRSTLTAGQSQSWGPIKAGGKRSCVTVTQRESFCPSLFWLVCTTGTERLLCSTFFFFFFQYNSDYFSPVDKAVFACSRNCRKRTIL